MELEIQFRSDVPIGELLERKPNVQANGLPPGLTGAEISCFHNSRTAPRSDHEPMALRVQLHRPFRQQKCEPPCVFVVARHFHGCLGPLELQGALASMQRSVERSRLFVLRSGGCRAGFFQQMQVMLGRMQIRKAGGAEEYDRVLNALTAETGQRLRVLGQNAQRASLRTVQKCRIFIS